MFTGQVLVGGDANDTNLSMLSNPMMWSTNTTADGDMDIFIFNSGDGVSSYTSATGIADYTDGTDKVAYYDGSSYLTTPFTGGQLTSQSMGGFTAVQEVGSSMFLFYVSGTVTFDDSDVVNPNI